VHLAGADLQVEALEDLLPSTFGFRPLTDNMFSP
jgi:hypothetical protein